MTFNSNVSPSVKKKERGDRTWLCKSCGTDNPPWWSKCPSCNKPKH